MAELLGNQSEYRKWFELYVRRLSQEPRTQSKTRELLDDLLGPPVLEKEFSLKDKLNNPQSGGSGSDKWNPLVCGLRKRMLLKEALEILSTASHQELMLLQYKHNLDALLDPRN